MKKQLQKGKKKAPNIQCWRCAKIGHPTRLCPEGALELAAVSMEEKGAEFGEHAYAAMTEGGSYMQVTWTIDSGVPCPHRHQRGDELQVDSM